MVVAVTKAKFLPIGLNIKFRVSLLCACTGFQMFMIDVSGTSSEFFS